MVNPMIISEFTQSTLDATGTLWTITPTVSGNLISNCNGIYSFGGLSLTNYQHTLTRTVSNLPFHSSIRVKVKIIISKLKKIFSYIIF